MKLDQDISEKLAKQLFEDFGFTFPRPPHSGWMVGGAGDSLKKLYSAYQPFTTNDALFTKVGKDIVAVAKNIGRTGYVGGWLEPDPNAQEYVIFLEESEHFITKDRAIQVAKQRGEKAIYSLKDKRAYKLEELQ